MQRRRFIKNALSLLALTTLTRAPAWGMTGNGQYICHINIKFPPNYTEKQFYADRNRWMSVSSFDKIVSLFERRGLLEKKESHVTSANISVLYYFKDQESHDAFVDLINDTRAVSDSKLESIGYKYSRSSYPA